MAGFNVIRVRSDYLSICVCNIRVPHWRSQSSQPGPLGAAVIWVIKIITIIKEIAYILTVDFQKAQKQEKKLILNLHIL